MKHRRIIHRQFSQLYTKNILNWPKCTRAGGSEEGRLFSQASQNETLCTVLLSSQVHKYMVPGEFNAKVTMQ